MGTGTIHSLEWVLSIVPFNPLWWFFPWPCVVSLIYCTDHYFAEYLRIICRSLEITPCSALFPLVLRLQLSSCSDLLSFSDVSLQLRDCAELCLVFLSLRHCLEAGTVIELMSSFSHFLGFALCFLFLKNYCLISSVLKTVCSVYFVWLFHFLQEECISHPYYFILIRSVYPPFIFFFYVKSYWSR